MIGYAAAATAAALNGGAGARPACAGVIYFVMRFPCSPLLLVVLVQLGIVSPASECGGRQEHRVSDHTSTSAPVITPLTETSARLNYLIIKRK